MKSRAKLTLVVSTVISIVMLAGCQADTAIGLVDGGTDTNNAPSCPAGPAAPLGQACTMAAQLCRYGYNVPNCGGRTVICTGGHWIEESHSDPTTACFDGGATDTDSGHPVEAGVDGTQALCCPRDMTMSGCLHLGGANTGALSCAETCDFWCSTNWRVETDDHGCEVWRFDHRSPAPGETLHCTAAPDAGADTSDASDARDASDASDARDDADVSGP